MKTLNLKKCSQIVGGTSQRHCDRLWRRYNNAAAYVDPDGHPNSRANRLIDKIIRLDF